MRIGGTAISTSAVIAGFTPVPMIGIRRISIARLGIIRSI